MFSELGSFPVSVRENKLIPVLGGDLICRFRDLNRLREDNRLVYKENVEVTSNKYGLMYGKDLVTYFRSIT